MNWQLVRSKLVGSVSEINWSLEQFWKFLLGEVWPLKGRKYLEERFELFKNIDLDKRNGRSIHLIYFLLVISAILSIVQCFHNEPAFVLLTFDFLGYNKLSASIKFSKALMNIAVFAFYQGNYFNISKVQTLVSYTRILTHNDRSCVFDSNFDFWKLIQGTLMFYQVFVVAFELGMLFFYLQLGVALSAHPFDQLYLWPLAYLSMSIGFFLHSVTCLLICVGGWAASATILMFKVLFEKLSFQSRRYLQHPIDRFTPLRLLRYRWHNAKLMKGQFELSHVFGNLLLTFLWTNIPMNVSIIALLALNKIPNAIIFYIGMITCLGKLREQGSSFHHPSSLSS